MGVFQKNFQVGVEEKIVQVLIGSENVAVCNGDVYVYRIIVGIIF